MMTQEEFRQYTEDYYYMWAGEIAREITIRSYTDGTSSDVKRSTTKVEENIIRNVCIGVFLAYSYRSEDTGLSVDSIMDTAEFTLHQFIPEANSYDTIYIPCKKKMGLWG